MKWAAENKRRMWSDDSNTNLLYDIRMKVWDEYNNTQWDIYYLDVGQYYMEEGVGHKFYLTLRDEKGDRKTDRV